MKVTFSIRPYLRSRRAVRIAASVAAVVVVGGLAYWLDDSPAPAHDPLALSAPASAPIQPRTAGRGTGEPTGSVEPADVRPDVALLFELDASGHLIIDADTGVALEALVGDLPEQPSPLDVQRTEDSLRRGLPPHEAAKAIGLLRSYRSYVAEVETQVAPGGIPQSLDDVNALFDRMAALRLKHFDRATADALFGAHEAYARYSMQTTFIEQDPNLSGPVKQDQLDRLRAQLTEEVKAMIPPLSSELQQLEQEVARMRREGATDEQIEALRQQRQPLPRTGG